MFLLFVILRYDNGHVYLLFRFGLGKLPAWARREVEDSAKVAKTLEGADSPDHSVHTGYRVVKVNKPPQGRWAQRIENNEIKIATFSPGKLILQFLHSEPENTVANSQSNLFLLIGRFGRAFISSD